MAQEKPAILYESVHRIEKLIKELDWLEFDGEVWIRRELSKKFEQKIWGTVNDIKQKLSTWEMAVKWEFVVVLAPKK
jgi:16S rRNA (cytidine1402-2'-O)-methyltransferase